MRSGCEHLRDAQVERDIADSVGEDYAESIGGQSRVRDNVELR